MTIRAKVSQYVKDQKIGQTVSSHKELYIGIAIGASAALILVKRQQTVNVITIMERN